MMHISDSHISLSDDNAPFTTRMFDAFRRTTDRATGESTSSSEEFVRLLKLACDRRVDLIALGGDIVNFPSNETVAWVLQRLREDGCGIPFVYTSGNHDWHEEGHRHEQRYDAARLPQLLSTLRPLIEHSAAPQGLLYGHARVKGVDVLIFDNSNYQINAEQLAFARRHLSGPLAAQDPAVLLLHMPLALPGLSLPPKLCCGHPGWGAAADDVWETEGRPRWPEEGNAPSTRTFIELVQAHAAPAGRIVALLTGHVHRDFSVDLDPSEPLASNRTALACDTLRVGCALRLGTSVLEAGSAIGADPEFMLEADGAVQYTTLDSAEGGYRLVTIHQGGDPGGPGAEGEAVI